MIRNGLYHCVIGSRILAGYALRVGMPVWKYLANRFLTLSENLLVGLSYPSIIQVIGLSPENYWPI